MLYLLYVLTFLAGILFYVMTPRDDQVNLDTYRAEGFIVSFLSQHQAAKDYMTQWLGFDLKHNGTNNRADSRFFSLAEGSTPNNGFVHFLPRSINADISDRQETEVTMGPDSDGSYRFLTSVFCLSNTNALAQCNGAEKAYLATYSGSTQFPSWWPSEYSNRQRRYGAWRTAITRRTNGSYNCGTLVQVNVNGTPKWCVDNGQTVQLSSKYNNRCAQEVPDAIINALCPNNPNECLDALFCISRIKTGPQRYYVGEGLIAFYDAINNQNTGAEGERYSNNNNAFWEDLIRNNKSAGTAMDSVTGDMTTGATFPASPELGANSGVIFPDLDIVDSAGGNPTIFHDFTLTILLKGPGDNDLDLSFELVDNNLNPWNISLRLRKPMNGNPSIYFADNNGNSQIPANPPATPLQNIDPNSRIMSVTIVGNSNELNVYVNAYQEPVATLKKSDVESNPTYRGYFDYGNIYDKKHLMIPSKSTSAHIYGVRYYSRPLSVRRIKNTGTPSELEQNFKLDSKRYGIGVHYSYNPRS